MFRSTSLEPINKEAAVSIAAGLSAMATVGIASGAGASKAVIAGSAFGVGVGCCLGLGYLAFFGLPCKPEKNSLEVNSENENTPLNSNFEL